VKQRLAPGRHQAQTNPKRKYMADMEAVSTPELGSTLDSIDFGSISDNSDVATGGEETSSASDIETTPETEVTDDAPETDEAGTQEGDPGSEEPENLEPEDEEISEDEASKLPSTKDGKSRIVPKNRWDHVYGVYKQAKAIEQALGSVPSVEEIQTFSRAYENTQLMMSDIESGDESRVGNFVKYWSKKSETALPQLVSQSIDTLATTSPEQYNVLVDHFEDQIVSRMYEKAAQMKAARDPYYQKYLFGVQSLDYQRSKGYREDDDIVPPDPVQQKLERASQIERNQRERDVRASNEAATLFRQGVDGDITAARTASVDQALTPIAEQYKGKPTLFNAIQDNLTKQAVKMVTENRVFQAKYQPLRERAERTRNVELADEAIKAYKNQFELAVKKLAPSILKEANSRIVAENQAKHAAAKASAAKREPSGTGSPVSPKITNGKYQSAAEKRDLFSAVDGLFG
jgi:hypothetical protein